MYTYQTEEEKINKPRIKENRSLILNLANKKIEEE